MILKYKSLKQLGFYAFIFLTFFACTKQDTIRPSIEKRLLATDSLTLTQPEQSILKLDSLLQNSKHLTTLETAILLFNKGEALYLNDKYQEAFNTHLKCNELFAELNDTYNESRSLISLSGAALHM
ncbi:MAG: sensor histidine kinase, partial [Maribacter stanieri]